MSFGYPTSFALTEGWIESAKHEICGSASCHRDAEFLNAIGIKWDGQLPSLAAHEAQESGAKLLMKPRTD
jgi:hypothetical protein